MSTSPKVAVSDVKAALISAVGADAVTTAPEELDAYTADTYWPALAATAAGAPLARPEIVVRPRTEEDVAAVLAAADAQRTPVVAWGGGSGTQGGALPIHGGIVLDLRSLDRVLDVDETSMTVTAQAGVNGRRLESELNARGLMLPHYPASVEWATVGGYIAARGSGVLSTRYGKIEDLLLNLRVAAPATGPLETAAEAGGELLDPALGQRWWDRRYDFYHPPHQPELPAIWGTLDVVAKYSKVEAVYEALHTAIREPYAASGLELRMHFSHWYPWGTMIYGRFVVPDGGPDALELHDRIWEDGMTAALDAGGVMNDHHGVGIKLGPYMRRQHGGALDAIRQIKAALDPNNIMNPGKMGL